MGIAILHVLLCAAVNLTWRAALVFVGALIVAPYTPLTPWQAYALVLAADALLDNTFAFVSTIKPCACPECESKEPPTC